MRQRLFSDRYRLEQRLETAEGWQLYRAVDVCFPRNVRVTVLSRRAPSAIELIRTRVRSLAGLSHQHIISIYDVEWEADGCRLVSEYRECLTLQQAIGQGRRFSLEEAVAIALQIAGAIAHAHQQQVLHGQLSCDMIWIYDRHAKVDFVCPPALEESTTIEVQVDLVALGNVLRQLFAATSLAENPDVQAKIGELLDRLTDNRQPSYTNAADVAYDLKMILTKDVCPLCPTYLQQINETTRVWEGRQETGEAFANERFSYKRRESGWPIWSGRIRFRLVPYFIASIAAVLAGIATFFLVFANPDKATPAQRTPVADNRPVHVAMAETTQAASTITISPAEPISRLEQRPRLVPQLVGLQQQEAEKLLLSLGMRYAYYLERSDQPPGTVFKQAQAPNTPYPPGERVVFYVSSGK
ncbi:protein kinase domain-containing protein [Effusibacillus pohliae]|uniref:protein kinase domain-containing protein n=1 Tax=Effusibacillus pohliae TaxID=232270 RepID=UPI00036766EE|nr:PASTA domain-containing protein [Effusibacillus pohliae]